MMRVLLLLPALLLMALLLLAMFFTLSHATRESRMPATHGMHDAEGARHA